MNEQPSSDLAPRGRFWARFRVTLGPIIVGVVGGVLIAGLTLTAVPVLLKNCAATYDYFPSLDNRPWLAADWNVPEILTPLFLGLAFLGPIFMGLATTWLVRPRDRWEDVSAGLSTGLAATISCYLFGLGWAVTLATVIVPSISDLTLMGDAVKTPAAEKGHPSDLLVQRYPDLAAVAADERGGRMFPKIVADQVIGSATGVWAGVGLALATCGVIGIVGALAGGFLLRRGGSFRSVLLPYVELTVPISIALMLIPMGVSGLIGTNLTMESALAGVLLTVVVLAVLTALIVRGVVRRWPWLLRVVLAAAWVLTAMCVGGTPSWPLVAAAVGANAILVALMLRAWLPPRPQATLGRA